MHKYTTGGAAGEGGGIGVNYRVIDRETYYRRGVFRHFSEDCKCSTSMTARVDVTGLAARSRLPPVEGAQFPGGLPHGLAVADQ